MRDTPIKATKLEWFDPRLVIVVTYRFTNITLQSAPLFVSHLSPFRVFTAIARTGPKPGGGHFTSDKTRPAHAIRA
ncbi:hypothetical protein [Primorskyibacter sp. 2E233]|uniref:hypothetical protein n=1 Tax=Primorskyibacter sp. 2E233 TaxID=3413431 RepID=UPI003BF35CA4